jgi:hypothetical protein
LKKNHSGVKPLKTPCIDSILEVFPLAKNNWLYPLPLYIIFLALFIFYLGEISIQVAIFPGEMRHSAVWKLKVRRKKQNRVMDLQQLSVAHLNTRAHQLFPCFFRVAAKSLLIAL